MTIKHWEGLENLSKIRPFDKPNIIDHMLQFHTDWEAFIHEMDEHAAPLMPGPYGQFQVAREKAKPLRQIQREKKRKEIEQ